MKQDTRIWFGHDEHAFLIDLRSGQWLAEVWHDGYGKWESNVWLTWSQYPKARRGFFLVKVWRWTFGRCLVAFPTMKAPDHAVSMIDGFFANARRE